MTEHTSKASSRWRIARRAFWAIMLIGHAPAVLSSVTEDGGLARFAFLFAAEIFFVLKLLDVPWLRAAADRRTIIALIAVFALLHTRVIVSSVAHDPASPDTWNVLALVGGLSWTAFLVRRPQRGAGGSSRRERVKSRSLAGQISTRLLHAVLPPRFLMLARSCAVDRAPPVSHF